MRLASSWSIWAALARVAGLLGTMAQYSPTLAERSWVPISRARWMISSLLKLTKGRRTGWALADEITERFCRVWEETWPTASPVTIAEPPRSPAICSATRSISRFKMTCQ